MKHGRSKKRYSKRRRLTESLRNQENPDAVKLIGIGAIAGIAAHDNYLMLKPENWASFFNEKIPVAVNSIGSFFGATDTWKTFATYIVDNYQDNETTVSQIIAAMPEALGKQILKLCSDPDCMKDVIEPKNLGLLALIGVPLSVYLYVKISGTEHEKEVLEKKLKQAKRFSESSNHKRRRLQQLTDMDSSSEDSESFSRSNRPRSSRRRNKNHV
jgi:hypothetical protein